MQNQNKVLIHACCGVCFSYPSFLLKEMGFEPVVYYFNPNIYPMAEFERRYGELEKFCAKYKIELIKEDYNHNDFLQNAAAGYESEPEKGARCRRCFYLRLKKTFEKARALNINKLTTTLTVSPHKVSKDIFDAAKKAYSGTDIEFLEFDFKKKDGFKKTIKIADENNMYRQTYCGCEFSLNKQ